MRVELRAPETVRDARPWVKYVHGIAMILRPGSIEWGVRRNAMERVDYAAGDLGVCSPNEGKWVGLMSAPHLQISISDSALSAASGTSQNGVELRPCRKLTDPRLTALASAARVEMAAGYPNGKLFLDTLELSIAVVLVNGHAAKRPSELKTSGLDPSRLHTIKEFVEAHLDHDLTLAELAQAAGLSSAHFARMFRKSMGETPHQYVTRLRLNRAKEMLRTRHLRVLDVALATGFKTQQHFAQVFRDFCGASPTQFRQDASTAHMFLDPGTPPSY